MKQFGIALQSYHDALKTFPPGATMNNVDFAENEVYMSFHCMMLPYFEEEGLKQLYEPTRGWQFQTQISEVARPMYYTVPATVIPVFNCPSADGDNPKEDRQLTKVFLLAVSGSYTLAEQGYGTTNYVICKGVSDTWTRQPGKQRKELRGIFDINWAVPIKKITDGTSHTIAMGEGADGSAWSITELTNTPDRNTPTTKTNQGLPYKPWAGWICGQVPFQSVAGGTVALIETCSYACTIEPMNKNPVTQSYTPNQENQASGDWNKVGLAFAPGLVAQNQLSNITLQTTGFSCANFRSDHSGGGNFMMADGSVHFLNEDIDMLTYQRLSTMRGDDIVDVPQ